MDVKLIQITPDAERLMAYCARVSSPNQDNPDYEGLLRYCMKHGHWSVFEQADMTIEITTSRAISAQLIRHKSFSWQEHSQRYSSQIEFEYCNARRQDTKNRQNSIDDLSEHDKAWWLAAQARVFNEAYNVYRDALDKGIAKECARMVLPMATQTRLYMKGSIRSWIHYLQVRTNPDTQLEHRQIADAAKVILIEQLPTIGKLI